MIVAMHEISDTLHDVFERFGRIDVRRMFGGHGVFHAGRMFALVAQGRLYLKTDAQTVGTFEARQLQPFTYQRQGTLARLHYHEAPAEVFDDHDEAARWARLAWDAALRASALPRRPRGPSPRARKARR